MQNHLTRIGKQLNISFAFAGRTGNTRDSHRLIQLGKTKSETQQTRVVEQLFNAYFEENEDITDQAVLISRGIQAGLDEPEVRKWMESDAGGEEVDREVGLANGKFISGVPNFTYVFFLNFLPPFSFALWRLLLAKAKGTNVWARDTGSTKSMKSTAPTSRRLSCRFLARSRIRIGFTMVAEEEEEGVRTVGICVRVLYRW